MAWEWSYSPEGEQSILDGIEALDRDELEEICGEWGIEGTDRMSHGHMVEIVFDRASDWKKGRTCDNGGHHAWICPTGCHKIEVR